MEELIRGTVYARHILYSVLDVVQARENNDLQSSSASKPEEPSRPLLPAARIAHSSSAEVEHEACVPETPTLATQIQETRGEAMGGTKCNDEVSTLEKEGRRNDRRRSRVVTRILALVKRVVT